MLRQPCLGFLGHDDRACCCCCCCCEQFADAFKSMSSTTETKMKMSEWKALNEFDKDGCE